MDIQDPNHEPVSLDTTIVAPEREGQGDISGDASVDTAEEEDEDTSLQTEGSSNNRRNQFRPRPGGKQGTTSYQLRQYAEATLGGGSLRKIVKLPEGEDENEWFAVNMVDFYNQINLLYGAITEFCSPQSCPEMKATDE